MIPVSVNILIISTIVTIVFMVTFVVLAILHTRQREKYFEEQNEKIRQLSEQNNPLIVKLLQWRNDITIEKEKLKSVKKGLSRQERLQLDKEMYDSLLHTDDFKQFIQIIDSNFNNFADKVMRKFDLSEKDYRLLLLILLDISDDDISTIMGYSYGSMPTTKVRLAKKIGLKQSAQLRPYLLSLLTS